MLKLATQLFGVSENYLDYCAPLHFIIFDEDDVESYLRECFFSTKESLRIIMKEMPVGTRTKEFDGSV